MEATTTSETAQKERKDRFKPKDLEAKEDSEEKASLAAKRARGDMEVKGVLVRAEKESPGVPATPVASTAIRGGTAQTVGKEVEPR